MNPDVDIQREEHTQNEELPALEGLENWYVYENGEVATNENGTPSIFKGNVTIHDIIAFVSERIQFTSEYEPVEVRTIYSTEDQTISIDLDQYVEYATRGPASTGRYTYKITKDANNLDATLNNAGTEITISANKSVNSGGYIRNFRFITN